MLRHDAPPPAPQGRSLENTPTKPLDGKVATFWLLEDRVQTNRRSQDIFAFIIEIEQADNLSMPRPLPAIALCDLESPDNWVSQHFIDYLSKYFPTNLKLDEQPKRWRANNEAHINIRWTCGKLGQHSEEGTFLIKPRAQFKILFGCGSRVKNDLAKAPGSAHSATTSHIVDQRLSKSDSTLSARVVEGLKRGVEDGTLLKLIKMPATNQDEDLYVSVAELEAQLEYVYGSYTTMDQALGSMEDEDSTLSLPLMVASGNPTFDAIARSPVVVDEDEHTSTPSTTNPLSEGRSKQDSHSEERRREQLGKPSPSIFSAWVGQPIWDDPQPWIRRTLEDPERPVGSFRRCETLDSRHQQVLEEAKAVVEKESAGYWIWDENIKNYKHYDEGSAEPVWYNPP
jgi:hypothetical protein